jgi:hypothetical protein
MDEAMTGAAHISFILRSTTMRARMQMMNSRQFVRYDATAQFTSETVVGPAVTCWHKSRNKLDNGEYAVVPNSMI